jgi:hypothetical protein
MATASADVLASVPTAPTDSWLCLCGYVNRPDEHCARCFHEPPPKRRRTRRILRLP